MPAKKAKETKGAVEPEREVAVATPEANAISTSHESSEAAPHTLEISESPIAENTTEPLEAKPPKTIPQLAYELFALRVEGHFPPFRTLKPATQTAYNEAAAHVLFGNEPRTDYERAVQEILAPAFG